MALFLNRLDALAVLSPPSQARSAGAVDVEGGQAHASSCRLTDIPVPAGAPLQLAIVMSYLWDTGWFADHVPALRAARRGLVIGQESRDKEKKEKGEGDDISKPLVDASLGTQWGVLMPAIPDPFGCQHAKGMILFYAGFVRVVIHSNNHLSRDMCRKTGSIYVQTFPLLPPGGGGGGGVRPGEDFGAALTDFFAAMSPRTELLDKCIAELHRYDYSAARVGIVASVPGTHGLRPSSGWGARRLEALLRADGPDDAPDPSAVKCVLWAQTTSYGSMYTTGFGGYKPLLPFLKECFSATRPSGGGGGAGTGTGAGIKRPREEAGAAPAPPALPMSIMWPTAEFIRRSTEGWAGGASVPGPDDKQRDLQRYFVPYEGAPGSGRERSVPHIKTVGRCHLRADGSLEIAWLYTGSHNLSGAAWGVAKKDGSLKILSFELGVVATPRRWAASVNAEAAQVAAGRFPPAAWLGVSGMVAQPGSRRPETPTPPPRFTQLPWQSLRAAGGGGAGAGAGRVAAPPPGEVWLPLPFRLPPREWAPGSDLAWTKEGIDAITRAPLPGRDGFGRSVYGVRGIPGTSVYDPAEAIPRDPGPLAGPRPEADVELVEE